MVPLFGTYVAGRESEYVQDCVRSGWLAAGGEYNQRFGKALQEKLGVKHAILCDSGTSAIHLVLRHLGANEADCVWVSDLTFVATSNPILYVHATPILVDAHPGHWNVNIELMSSELKRRADLGQRPKAVLVAHILGRACRLEPLLEIAARYEVPVIEDAAEAFSATVDGQQAGTHGLAGCFSFNGNKQITTGGGGLIATNDDALAKRTSHLLNQAKLPGPGYMHDDVGYNYRLSNLAAAVGLAQLENLPEILTRKHRIAERYRCLADVPGLTLPVDEPGTVSSDWLTTILIDETRFGMSRDAVMNALGEDGIETRPIWSPLHKMPMYARCERIGGEVADRLDAQGLSLPSFAGLTEDQQNLVIEGIRRLYSR